jgi:MoxR-like ATPase
MTTPATETTALCDAILNEVELAVVGKRAALTLILTTVLANGHVLIEDLPGMGKTLIARSFAAALGLRFTRVQFTPDLLPADLLGSTIYDMRSAQFEFRRGPIFTNMLMADEINRTPPKTQAALLEAMAEGQVSMDGETHQLPDPFIVIATDNPIEFEGTYPLPEAQLDRFLFKVDVPGVSAEVMTRILTDRRRGEPPAQQSALGAGELDELFALVDGVFLPQAVAHYIARLVQATHGTRADSPAMVRQHVRYGASPRAAIAIGEAARAAALLAGRPNVDFADVQRVAVPALAHRLVLQHGAVVAGVTARDLVAAVLAAVPAVARALPEAVQ